MTVGAALRVLTAWWRRRPLQLIATVTGLVLATALWSGVQALNAQARASYAEAAALLGGAELARIRRVDGRAPTLDDFARLRRDGWPVSPVLDGALPLGGARYRVIGVDPVSAPQGAGAPSLAAAALGPDGVDFAAFAAPPYLGLAAPETVAEIAAAEAAFQPELRAVEGLAPGVILLDIGAAGAVLRRPDAMSHLLIDAEDKRPRAPLDPAYELVAPSEDGELDRLTDSFHLNLTAFGLLAFVVGLFIVHGAVGLSLEQRRPTFRTLRAIGVPARSLAAALAIETTVLALVAGAIGLALGYLLAAALSPSVSASLRGLYGAPAPGELGFSWVWAAAGLGMSLAGAWFAAGFGVARVARAPILALGAPQGWAGGASRMRVAQLAAAAASLGVAVAAFALVGGLVAAFVVLAGALLGAALALPSLLALALAALERLLARLDAGPVARWFAADARQSVGPTTMALMALLLALAASIGVGAMVESFRGSFTRWLDYRLASEVYVSVRDPAEVDALRARLEADPRVDAVLPLTLAEARHAERPIELIGATDHATYREFWPLLEVIDAGRAAAWDAVAAGAGAMASEQFMRRRGLAVGDRIALRSDDGVLSAQIVASFADYGAPKGRLLFSDGLLRDRWRAARVISFGLRTAPEQADALAADLRAELGRDETGVMDQAGVKALSQEVFNATFLVTDALAALTLGVAGVALFISLLSLSDARLAQWAPVWAAGVERRRLERLELGKAAALAALTAAAATPLGVATAWILVALVNVEAFGWRLPLEHFPAQWARLGLIAVAAALLAAYAAAAPLRRAPPSALIRVFANDR